MLCWSWSGPKPESVEPVPMIAASGNGIAPIDGQTSAGHEGGGGRGEEQKGACDILGVTPARHEGAQVDGGNMDKVGAAFCGLLGDDETGGHGVDPDLVGSLDWLAP